MNKAQQPFNPRVMRRASDSPRGSGETEQQETAIDSTVVKPLDYKFKSFGEALAAWTNSGGFQEIQHKCAGPGMVTAFCNAMNIPCGNVSTMRKIPGSVYFESNQWLYDYLEENAYVRHGMGTYLLLDEYYRPTVHISVIDHIHFNVEIEITGDESVVLAFRELVKLNLKKAPNEEVKEKYLEVITRQIGPGMVGLIAEYNEIEHKRVVQPEYYPFLDGGMEALLRDFMESEESVLIFKGPPGTGKTSGLIAGITSLHMLPIYAKKTEAITHKDFVPFVFKVADEQMSKVSGSNSNRRKELFVEELVKEREFKCRQDIIEQLEDEPRVPVVIVEDADSLIAARKDGNPLMADLLNETDGLASNDARKIIFTTNIDDVDLIDEALMREGRCYAVVNFCLLTPAQAVAARRAANLPDFEKVPEKNTSLAAALRKPRKRICISNGKASIGFGG